MRRVSLALALVAVLLASCSSVRLSYNHADWLAAHMADRYVDLTDDQVRTFRARLSDLHAWHRARELPVYAQVFDEAAGRLEHGMRRTDAEWAVAAVRAHMKLLGEQAAGELAPAMASLSDRQIADMQRRFAEDNGKFVRTQMNGDRAQRATRRAAWLDDRLEDWIGRLTSAQRARVRRLVDAFPDMARLRLEERERRQANLLALLREERRGPDFENRVRGFLADPDAGRSEASRRAMAQWERQFIDMLVDLDASLTPQQRATAVKRMRGYANDFRQLATVSNANVLEARSSVR